MGVMDLTPVGSDPVGPPLWELLHPVGFTPGFFGSSPVAGAQEPISGQDEAEDA